jgi:hypothetical protein
MFFRSSWIWDEKKKHQDPGCNFLKTRKRKKIWFYDHKKYNSGETNSFVSIKILCVKN